MEILKEGNRGPSVALLQLALNRADFGPIQTDGIFGEATKAALIRFQSSQGLRPDAIAGTLTHNALMPWYTAFTWHKVRPGDTFFSLAQQYGSSISSIMTANPDIQPDNLQIGSYITVPLSFSVVPTDIDYFSELISFCIQGLAARYPFIKVREIGKTVMGKPIWGMLLGKGENRVIYAASFHANEWITTPVLLKFIEELCSAYAANAEIYGKSAAEILNYCTFLIIPALNPDAIDLVTGQLKGGEYYNKAKKIAAKYPAYPFPSGWKANIAGTDLNLQFPAGWEQARENKYAMGIISPAPGDYVGPYPLSAPESKAIYDITLSFDPSLILAYHTQGMVIYWKYLDYEPYNSKAIAELFSSLSGYSLEDTPYAAGFAGYKDWFIQDFNRPGYTIEAGRGRNPLPISDFPTIYKNNLGILTFGGIVT